MRTQPGPLARGLADLFGANAPEQEAACFMIADVLIGIRHNTHKQ